MKLSFLGVEVVCLALVLSVQTEFAQSPQMVKVIGCLQGDGSELKPWIIAGVAIPPPPAATPAGGGGGRGGAGGGAAPDPGAGPGAGAPAGAGAAGGGQGRGGGGAAGRGGGGGRGGGATVPAVPAPPVQLVDLRPAGGMNLMPWRGMKIELEGTLGAKPASGPQEITLTSARSVQGVCTPK